MNTIEIIKNKAEENNIELSEKQLSQLDRYMKEILTVNQEINLTGITEPEAFIERNIIDSLLIVKDIQPKGMKIADIGTGGGFPGVPLAIYFPEDQFVLIDSTKKKLDVVETAVKKIGLSNVKVLAGRAEELSRLPEEREQYDYVVSRAVAPLRILCELCLPLLKKGGEMIALKSARYDLEIKDAENTIKLLGGKLLSTEKRYILHSDMLHVIIIVEKIRKTPEQYPRSYGQIKKKAL